MATVVIILQLTMPGPMIACSLLLAALLPCLWDRATLAVE
ncbi:MAG: hypothetical protein ACJAQ3_002911, partial [Planctomycetota bacterium]